MFEKSTCPESSDNEGSDGQRGADPDGGHHLVHEVGDDEGARASTGCREQKNITWGNLNYKLYYSTILATVKLITYFRYAEHRCGLQTMPYYITTNFHSSFYYGFDIVPALEATFSPR